MLNRRLNLVTAPTIEPVTLDEAKTFLKIDGSDEDLLVTSLISSARQKAESFTRRAFLTQTWQLFLNAFPNSRKNTWQPGFFEMAITELSPYPAQISIPKSPLISVTHVKTYAIDGTATTFSSSNYDVLKYAGDFAEEGRIALKSGQSWPDFTREADGIEVQFVAGYGAAALNVPYGIKDAILHEAMFLYEGRGCQSGMGSPVAAGLLQPFKIMKV